MRACGLYQAITGCQSQLSQAQTEIQLSTYKFYGHLFVGPDVSSVVDVTKRATSKLS